MDLIKKILAVLTAQQDSGAKQFNWKDVVHVIRMAGATALVVFLKDVDKADFGLFDTLVSFAIVAGVTAVEAWKVDNS